jgi:hypothetical protein
VTNVNSLKNDLCSRLGPKKINNGLGVFLWMKQSIRDEIYVHGKEGGRDAKHDDCQYHHRDGRDCLLSPAAVAKAGEPLCLDPRMDKSNVQQVESRERQNNIRA